MALVASRPSSRVLAILAMVATTALWGVSYPLIKQLIDVFPPCTLAVLRLAIALAVLVPLLFVQGGRPRFGWPAVALGVTGVAAFQLLQNVGMEQMPAGPAVIVLVGSSMVMTSVLGWAVLGESCSPAIVVALLGSAAGVALVARGSGDQLEFPLVGLTLLLASALAWSVYTVIGRRSIASNMNELNTGALIVGLILMLPFAFLERPNTASIDAGAGDIATLLLLGSLVTGGAYCLWTYSIQHLRANEASVLCSIEPAFGLIFAWMLLRESISPQEALGAVVIVASCALVARGDTLPEPQAFPATAEAV